MSKKYKMVKNWYASGVFAEEVAKQMVKNAVVKGMITEEEYENITGEKYEE